MRAWALEAAFGAPGGALEAEKLLHRIKLLAASGKTYCIFCDFDGFLSPFWWPRCAKWGPKSNFGVKN